jgi:hypothetical protein
MGPESSSGRRRAVNDIRLNRKDDEMDNEKNLGKEYKVGVYKHKETGRRLVAKSEPQAQAFGQAGLIFVSGLDEYRKAKKQAGTKQTADAEAKAKADAEAKANK